MTDPDRPRSPWRIHPQDCACDACRPATPDQDRALFALHVVEACLLCALAWCLPLVVMSTWWGLF